MRACGNPAGSKPRVAIIVVSAHFKLRVNPRLDLLQPYPFEKLRALFAGVTPDAQKRPISLSLGEPRHPTPRLILDALVASSSAFSNYPTTIGSVALREAIAAWLVRR